MKEHTKTALLLEQLVADSNYSNLMIPETEPEQRKLIRSLMNIRMPRQANENLLQLQDDYLQETLMEKGIVSLADIPTIQQQYGSTLPFADRISLWQGDITRLKAGAIVNAANSRMLGCFVPCHHCIDNAIHSAAGIQLRLECDQIMEQRRQHGIPYEEPVGTATLTRSYNLPCDYVIHTVGPIVYEGLTPALCRDLRSCYEAALTCCIEHHIRSIAFCCISTGEFHFPNDKAAEIAVKTVTDVLEARGGDCMERVIFNVFKDTDLDIYKCLLTGS